DLPTRPPRGDDSALPPFPEPEGAPPVAQTILSPGRTERVVERDIATGEMTYRNEDHSGRYRLDAIGLELESSQVEIYRIGEREPNSALVDIAWNILLRRGDWRIRTETRTVMRSTATEFLIDATL